MSILVGGLRALGHRALLLLIVPVALACGPTTGQRAGQSVAPVAAADSVEDPTAACLESVLTASQLVLRYIPARPNQPRARYFELRNPPSERTAGLGIAILPGRGAPEQIVAQFAWPGPWQGTNGMQKPSDPGTADMVGDALTGITAVLMRELRAQCAPTITGQPACSRISQGRAERCTLGS